MTLDTQHLELGPPDDRARRIAALVQESSIATKELIVIQAKARGDMIKSQSAGGGGQRRTGQVARPSGAPGAPKTACMQEHQHEGDKY